MRARRWFPLGGALVAVVLWCSPGSAAAQSCLIELDGVDGAVQFDGLAPGDTRAWWTTVRNVSGEPVELSLTVGADGPLRQALLLDVHECDRAWDGALGGAIECAGDTSDLVESASLADPAPERDLGALPPDGAWHGRFTATMRGSAGNEFQAAAGSVAATFTAEGGGTACTTPPEPTTPTTTPTTPPITPTTTPDADRGAPGPPGPSGPRGPRGPRGAGGAPVDSPAARRGPLAWTGVDLAGTGALAVGLLAVGTVLRSRRGTSSGVSERTGRDPRAGAPSS